NAAVAVATWTTGGARVVAAVRQTVVQTQSDTATNDVRLGKRDERGVDVKAAAFHTGAGGHGRERFERSNEFRTTIRIAGVVKRVDTDARIAGVDRLCPAERNRKEDRVTRGDIG